MSYFAVICFFVVLLLNENEATEEHCFKFKGDSYLVFSPSEPYNNRDAVHYELQFRTSELNGVLMYARGAYGDREALYIRGGNLYYHLFNTGQAGVGRQFGGDFVSEERVDNNFWITVHLYRAWVPSSGHGGLIRSSRPAQGKTGIEFEFNGRVRSYVDYRRRENIDISRTIYFGGYISSLGPSVGNFTGEIKGIKEHANDFSFENPTLNYKSLVDLQCSD